MFIIRGFGSKFGHLCIIIHCFLDLYGRVTALKQKNPNLKALLSVGGAGEGVDALFSGMAGDAGKRGAFIGSIGYFISTYNFDGMDIDWEVPQSGDRVIKKKSKSLIL